MGAHRFMSRIVYRPLPIYNFELGSFSKIKISLAIVKEIFATKWCGTGVWVLGSEK